jgi:hypothetical protein
MHDLFVTYVFSILMHSCEALCAHKTPQVKQVNLEYCKMILVVRKNNY